MGRIDRYVLWQLLGVFGLASLVLVLVFWINRAVVLFDQIIADGQSAWVFVELTALALPSIVRLVIPLSAFGATLYALARLMGDLEVTVAQAAGVSPWRLARPVLAFGLVAAALASTLAHALVPLSLGRLVERQGEIAQTATARLLRAGEFIAPTSGVTLYIREVTADGALRDILISDARDPGEATLTTAASAYLLRGANGPQLVLIDSLVQRLTQQDGRLVTTRVADLAYDLGPLLPGGGGGGRATREVPTWELLAASGPLAVETGRDAPALRAEAHDRIAEGLLPPGLALIALGSLLAGGFSRLGMWRQVGFAIVAVIAVRALGQAASQAVKGDAGAWPLLYVAPLAGLALGGALLWRAARPWRVAGAAA